MRFYTDDFELILKEINIIFDLLKQKEISLDRNKILDLVFVRILNKIDIFTLLHLQELSYQIKGNIASKIIENNTISIEKSIENKMNETELVKKYVIIKRKN